MYNRAGILDTYCLTPKIKFATYFCLCPFANTSTMRFDQHWEIPGLTSSRIIKYVTVETKWNGNSSVRETRKNSLLNESCVITGNMKSWDQSRAVCKHQQVNIDEQLHAEDYSSSAAKPVTGMALQQNQLDAWGLNIARSFKFYFQQHLRIFWRKKHWINADNFFSPSPRG